jgi:hypothetical protein
MLGVNAQLIVDKFVRLRLAFPEMWACPLNNFFRTTAAAIRVRRLCCGKWSPPCKSANGERTSSSSIARKVKPDEAFWRRLMRQAAGNQTHAAQPLSLSGLLWSGRANR